MRPNIRPLPVVLGTATLMGFLSPTLLIRKIVGISGANLWLLTVLLGMLGVVAGYLVYRLLSNRAGQTETEDSAEARIVKSLFAEAKLKLATSDSVKSANLNRLPLMLLLGYSSSAKTTSVLQAGIAPEVLAGDIQRGEEVVSTNPLGIWYADGLVLVEAGGALLQSDSGFSRLLDKIRPARVGAAVFGASQAPRMVVACVSCDDIHKTDSSRPAAQLAEKLRQRLAEISREFKVRVPVYVLFTKADIIPHFTDYVRSMSHEEVSDVLGATLPLRSFESSGDYVDQQTRRIDKALKELYRSLANRRLDILPRESSDKVRHAAYQFPRSFNRVAPNVREFLVELCRPMHLGGAPVLRGFYFCGVRPVIEGDLTPSSAASSMETAVGTDASTMFDASAMREQLKSQRQSGPSSASSVFSVDDIKEHGYIQPKSSRAGQRVPQWIFLKRVISDVILKDRVAMGLTQSGPGVTLLRRFVFAGALSLALILMVGTGNSYSNNKELKEEVASVLEAASVQVRTSADPRAKDVVVSPADRLHALEGMGQLWDRLRSWEDSRPPAGYRWGMYRGSQLLPLLGEAYLAQFRSLLWGQTWQEMNNHLEQLPPSPGPNSDYDSAYNTLKAYILTTGLGHFQSSTDFLSDELIRHWDPKKERSDDERALARLLFQRFALLLKEETPYADRADESLVSRTRSFLNEFATVETFYGGLLARVSARERPYVFEDVVSDDIVVMRVGYHLPGAFTRRGWDAAGNALRDTESLFSVEEWVVGERDTEGLQKAKFVAEIEALYARAYTQHWRSFLRFAEIPKFASIEEAAKALDILSGSDSPILRVVSLVSTSTDVSSSHILEAFSPIHRLHPPTQERAVEIDGQVIHDYLEMLARMKALVDRLAAASGPDRVDEVLKEIDQEKEMISSSIVRISRDFDREGEARAVGDAVVTLLESPLAHLDALLAGYSELHVALDINRQGAQFCARFNAVAGQYPFSVGAAAEADLDEVRDLLQPGSSLLNTFHRSVIGDLVVQMGGRYAARPAVNPEPTSRFLAFYTQAHRVSNSLFRQGDSPSARFFLRIEANELVPEIDVTIGNQTQLYTLTHAPLKSFTWDSQRVQSARINARIQGRWRVLVDGSGPWAVFRLFENTGPWRGRGQRYQIVWRVPEDDIQITGEITFADAGLPVFQPGVLQMECVPGVVSARR